MIIPNIYILTWSYVPWPFQPFPTLFSVTLFFAISLQVKYFHKNNQLWDLGFNDLTWHDDEKAVRDKIERLDEVRMVFFEYLKIKFRLYHTKIRERNRQSVEVSPSHGSSSISEPKLGS